MHKVDKVGRVRPRVEHPAPARDSPLMRELLKVALILGLGLALSAYAHAV